MNNGRYLTLMDLGRVDALEKEVARVAPLEAEFGLPQWVFGMATYAFLDSRTILATYTRDGAMAGV